MKNQPSENRYLTVEIYRAGSDCTLNGVTSPERAAGKIFVVPCEYGYWKESEVVGNDSFVILDIEKRNIGREIYTNLVPREAGNRWTMFGGNFARSSDSRFRQSVSERPLPVHDRIE